MKDVQFSAGAGQHALQVNGKQLRSGVVTRAPVAGTETPFTKTDILLDHLSYNFNLQDSYFYSYYE